MAATVKKRCHIYLPADMIARLDRLSHLCGFRSRNATITALVRLLLRPTPAVTPEISAEIKAMLAELSDAQAPRYGNPPKRRTR